MPERRTASWPPLAVAVDGLTDGVHDEFRAVVRAFAIAYASRVRADYAAFVAWAGDPCAD